VLAYTDFIILFLLGSIGAFLSGFLGVGGGIVYIPILDYFLSKLGFNDDNLVKAILANSLFTIIFSGSVSSYKQYKLGNFYPREIFFTAITGVLTAVLMTLLIKSGTWYSKSVFNYVFASMLLIIALRMFFVKVPAANASVIIKPLGFYITGFFAGIVTAMSGLGGGVIMTPVFTDLLKLNIKKASAISNGVIPFFAIAVGILNLNTPSTQNVSEWQVGYVVFPVVIPMILSTFFLAPLGVMASQKANQKTIRLVFASFISLVFVKTLFVIIQQFR
jgi:uncharacterized membrane protein YfcA